MLWGEIVMCSGMSNLIDLIICSGRTVTLKPSSLTLFGWRGNRMEKNQRNKKENNDMI